MASAEESRAIDGAPLGPWLVNGFKWFSSATDCQMTVFLARTPKGISAFFAPMRRTIRNDAGASKQGGAPATELNGVAIQRLKQKLGTRALPTAELELKGMRAYLIGDEGRGTKQIATVLNIARIHNAVSSMGFWGRGLAVSRAFARARSVGLKPLRGKPAHLRTLARMHAEYRANVMLTFFVVALLGVAEQAQIAALDGRRVPSPPAPAPSLALPDPAAAEHLLRLLTPVVKGVTAKTAVAGLSECMESMGGVGYLENEDMQFNIARLYRDAGVCAIWEGTTDMMAHDLLRVVYGKTSREVMSAMDAWVKGVLQNGGALAEQARAVARWWDRFRQLLEASEREEVEMRAREMMTRLGDVIMGALLIADARRDGDVPARETAKVWVATRERGEDGAAEEGRWQDRVARDDCIVFGTTELEAAEHKL